MDDSIKEYAKELRSLIDKSNESFERQLNYISAGSLGLSMIIIEKVVRDLSLTKCNSLLVLSWCFLGSTLISNLISHVYTSRVHSKTYKEIGENKYDYSSAVKRNRRIGIWNLISIGLLLLGLFFQILFITLNITSNTMSKDVIKPAASPDVIKGMTSTPPPKPSTGNQSTPPPPPPPQAPKK